MFVISIILWLKHETTAHKLITRQGCPRNLRPENIQNTPKSCDENQVGIYEIKHTQGHK